MKLLEISLNSRKNDWTPGAPSNSPKRLAVTVTQANSIRSGPQTGGIASSKKRSIRGGVLSRRFMDEVDGRGLAVKKVENLFGIGREGLMEAKRIVREVKLLRHLSHENIVEILDLLPVQEHALK